MSLQPTRRRSDCATEEVQWKRTHCLQAISKNVRGELHREKLEERRCDQPRDCHTLVTVHSLRAEVHSHDPCDETEKLLDGGLAIRRLVSTLDDADGHNRGVHAGEFTWRSDEVIVHGDLRGTTNVGTHRRPVFEDCQECHEPGVMEGVLCGRIVRARNEDLVGTRLTASYRLRFDPSSSFQDTGFTGTIEGAVLHACDTQPPTGGRRCVDLTTVTPGTLPNPWTHEQHTFSVHDGSGTLEPDASIVTWGTTTGLRAFYGTTVQLPAPADEVEVTLVHYSSAPTVTAQDTDGNVVDTAVMSVEGAPETLTLTGPGITRLEVSPPQGETLLLQVCSTT